MTTLIKLSVYVTDHEGYTPEEYAENITDVGMMSYAGAKVFTEKAVDIEEFEDDHPLNQRDATQQIYEHYLK